MARTHHLLGLLMGITMGCSTVPPPVGPVDLSDVVRAHEPVLGPGAVFETVDEAAIDGLAWCFLHSRGESPQRVRGGSVRALEAGGYSYYEVATARSNKPDRVYITVGPKDVAYFIHVPSPGVLQNESHSRLHRSNVDDRDPLHRPSYLLTPRLQVQLYQGEGDEKRVALLDRRELQRLARRATRQ